MADNQIIEAAKEHFGQVVAQQLERVERLKNEPDWEALPANTPRAIRTLLRKCASKDPMRRLRDIGDAALDMEEALTDDDEPLEPGFPRNCVLGPGRSPRSAWS